MRTLHALALLLAALVSSSRAVSAQERARDLGTPHPAVVPAAPRPPPRPRAPLPRAHDDAPSTAPQAIQSLTAQEHPGVGPRVFGDGRGEELTWDDPDLDLEPRGVVHVVISGSGSWLGATESFDESGGGTLSLALDFVLEPRVSLHLRLGASISLRTETRRSEGWDELRSAALSVRGIALLGVHLAQVVALRGGLELGEGRSFVFGQGDAGTLGYAVVAQLGVRLARGGVELGVEAAAEMREGAVISATPPARSIQELAPRVGAYFGLTL